MDVRRSGWLGALAAIVLATGCFGLPRWELESVPGLATVPRGGSKLFKLDWTERPDESDVAEARLINEPFPGITCVVGPTAPPTALEVTVSVAEDAPLADVRCTVGLYVDGRALWSGEAFVLFSVTE